MSAGPEHDAHAVAFQQVPRAHYVVDSFDLVVDMLHARFQCRKKRDFVVNFVDPQKRRIAYPVAYPRTEDLCPELFVSYSVGRAEPDVAKSGDAGITRRKIAAPAVMRPRNQVDTVATRVTEVHERLHVAPLALFGASGVHVDSCIAEMGRGVVEFVCRTQLESDHVILRITGEIHERVISIVAAVIARAGLGSCDLQTEDFLRILVCGSKISRAEPDIADIVELDQVITLRGLRVGNVDNVGLSEISVK